MAVEERKVVYLADCTCCNPWCNSRHVDPGRFSDILRDQLEWYRNLDNPDRGDLVNAEEAITAAARNAAWSLM